MVKKIAIIGGAGFIGYNLTDYFTNNGYGVKVISRNIPAGRFSSKHIATLEADVNETETIIDFIDDCESVIWLVTTSVPSTSHDTLIEDFISNVNPLIRFMEQAKKTAIKKFVFLSSGGTIYGDSPNHIPVDEHSSKDPISDYGLSKIVSEKYIRFLTNGSNLQSFILRPSNVYGVHQNLIKPQGVIGYAFKSILNETAIDLYGNGSVTRDFIYVTDLASAIHLCLESEHKKSKTAIYNVGSQEGYTIRQILDKINAICNASVLTNDKPARSFDCDFNVLNVDKIKKDMNWQPKVSLDEGLAKVWEWIKSEKNEG